MTPAPADFALGAASALGAGLAAVGRLLVDLERPIVRRLSPGAAAPSASSFSIGSSVDSLMMKSRPGNAPAQRSGADCSAALLQAAIGLSGPVQPVDPNPPPPVN